MGLFFDTYTNKNTHKMINTTKIKIGNIQYVLKSHSYRAMFKFEALTGKPVSELSTLQDQVTFIYCILETSNVEFPYSLEDFFDLMDENDSILVEFAKLSATLKKK